MEGFGPPSPSQLLHMIQQRHCIGFSSAENDPLLYCRHRNTHVLSAHHRFLALFSLPTISKTSLVLEGAEGKLEIISSEAHSFSCPSVPNQSSTPTIPGVFQTALQCIVFETKVPRCCSSLLNTDDLGALLAFGF